MNKKVDLAEVIALSKKVASAKDAVVSDLNTVSAFIDELSSMESFQGATANSAKNYFANGHQTIIASFQLLFINIHKVLEEQIKHFQTNVDMIETARISSHYLESLKKDIEQDFIPLEELSHEVQCTIIGVSDLVPVRSPDFTRVKYAKIAAHKTIEKLEMNMETFSQQKENQIKEMFHQLSTLMRELQTYTGQKRFNNFNKGTFATIQGMLFENGSPFFALFEKMANDEALTSDERSMLYNFLKNIYLDNDMKEEMEEIAAFINEEDIDKLKDRLNDKVVLSTDTLEGEMTKIMAYLYAGNLRPSESNVDRETRAKLETYFMLLKNYYSGMGRWDKAIGKVEELTYEKDPNDLSGHYFDSRLRIGPYRQVDRRNMTLGEYRDCALRDNGLDGDPLKFWNTSEVTYYTKANASSTHMHLENKKLLEEYANSTSKFITMKIMNKAISTVTDFTKSGPLVNTIRTIEEYDAEQKEFEDKISIRKAREVASMLKMEFAISEGTTVPLGSRPKLEVQLYPTEKSYDILNRWEEAYKNNPNIPYPKDEIEALDWEGINDFLAKNDTEIGEDLSDYITDGP